MSAQELGGNGSEAQQFTNTINGSSRGSKAIHQGIDPSTKKPLWEVPIASQKDLDEAVMVAQKAFVSWSQKTWQSRQEILASMSKILAEHHEEMAEILSKECGKPPQFAALEVQHSIGMLNWHAKTPPLTDKVIQDDNDLRLTLKYEPIGVVGAISPWNFPLVLSMAKIASGLLTGNSVIIKPSPFTPYSVLKFVQLVQPVLPPGVLQSLNGDEKLGPWIVSHPGIPKITFTGSTTTGKKIMETGAKQLKRITLELGGNDACIVCPDIDISKVAPQVALGAFFNSGQLCVASKRIYVHQDIYEEFLKAMVEVVGGWKVGKATAEGVMLGPVQNEMQYEIVKGYFEDSIKRGLKFVLGGEVKASDSLVIQPAIIDNPPNDSLVVTGEAFGPIVPLQPWTNEDEVITRVNCTNSGLGGSIWSSDIDRTYRLAGKFEAGTVWINSFGKPLPQAYFAGRKESGVGGEQGELGLLSYCNVKAIHHYKGDVGRMTVTPTGTKL